MKIILKKKEKNEKKGELLQSDENGENINLDFNNKDINDIKKKKCLYKFLKYIKYIYILYYIF